MKISVSWLSEYLDVEPLRKDLKGTLSKLTMRGLEVESVQDLSRGFDKVIIAKILVRDKHPNADRLSVCKVDTGTETLQIVCGAQNMKAGDKVALSMIGACLPNGLKIEKGKIRDVESFGMLCSEVELGIANESEGILILPTDAPIGKPLAPFLGREDVVFEINVTPNRGDALSHLGVAREFASILNQKLKLPAAPIKEGSSAIKVAVKLDSPNVKQYHARVINGLKIGPSPEWLQKRLLSIGLRPINNVVDVTNFVLMEYGQPLHAFDFSKISGAQIKVRQAKVGEKLLLLNGNTVSLTDSDLVIADAEKALALAGVMGGGNSEVTKTTTSILLEAAEFEPAAVRKTSKKFALQSDSSYRFERGIDSASVVAAMNRAVSLMIQVAGGEAEKGVVTQIAKPLVHKKVSFSVKEASEFLGSAVSTHDAVSFLNSVGFETSIKGDLIEAVVPAYRNDVFIKQDLFEEILRVKGYDTIESIIPKMNFIPDPANKSDLNHKKIEKIKSVLVAAGFSETVNFGFTSASVNAKWGGALADKAVVLKNPLNEEFSTMKTSLLGGLFSNLVFALRHQVAEVRLFEVRPVYFLNQAKETGVEEKWMLSGIVCGHASTHHLSALDKKFDYFDLKGVVESVLDTLGIRGVRYCVPTNADVRFHPAQTAAIAIGKGNCGLLGRVHPRFEMEEKTRSAVYAFEIELAPILDLSSSTKKYTVISKFPKLDRDLSLIVPQEITADRVLQSITKYGKPHLESIQVVDLYQGEKIPEKMKSVSVSFVLADPNRTLEDKDADAACTKILEGLKKELSITLRTQ